MAPSTAEHRRLAETADAFRVKAEGAETVRPEATEEGVRAEVTEDGIRAERAGRMEAVPAWRLGLLRLGPFTKDAFHRQIFNGGTAVNPDGFGTKACLHYTATVAGRGSAVWQFRLTPEALRTGLVASLIDEWRR